VKRKRKERKNCVWIYKNDGKKNKARFILGEIAIGKNGSENPLVCFGVNASKAKPAELDPTVSRVRAIANKEKEFDGWIMLNLHSERATDPSKMANKKDSDWHRTNLYFIKQIFRLYPRAKVWAAWGDLIENRQYLNDCLKDIVRTIKPYSPKWQQRGSLTKKGHPRHPLYLRKDATFKTFNIESYLKDFLF